MHDIEWNSKESTTPMQGWLRREIEGNTVANEPGDLGEILKRIDELLELNQITMRAASLATGNPDYIRNMRRQYEGKTIIKDGKRVVQRQYSADQNSLRRLVAPLNTTWEWLWKGAGVKFVPRGRGRPRKATEVEIEKAGRERYRVLTRARAAPQITEGGLVVSGSIEAEAFFEAGRAPTVSWLVPIDPNYPAESQSAFLVRDDSFNDVAEKGDYIIATAIESDTDLVIGSLVIVARIRAGSLVETTARRFSVVDHQAELTFASSDPRYRDQEPVLIPLLARKAKVGDDDIELRGIVVSRYQPV